MEEKITQAVEEYITPKMDIELLSAHVIKTAVITESNGDDGYEIGDF